jgi:hypothetical protein
MNTPGALRPQTTEDSRDTTRRPAHEATPTAVPEQR